MDNINIDSRSDRKHDVKSDIKNVGVFIDVENINNCDAWVDLMNKCKQYVKRVHFYQSELFL